MSAITPAPTFQEALHGAVNRGLAIIKIAESENIVQKYTERPGLIEKYLPGFDKEMFGEARTLAQQTRGKDAAETHKIFAAYLERNTAEAIRPFLPQGIDPEQLVSALGNNGNIPQVAKQQPRRFRNVALVLNTTKTEQLTKEQLTSAEPVPEKDATFFFWLNGNNETQAQAWSILRQLEFVGSDENMNLVAQVSRPHSKILDRLTGDKFGAYRYYVTRTDRQITDPTVNVYELIHLYIPPYTKDIQSAMIKNLGATSMGDWKNFADAMVETMNKFPSKKFYVYMQGPSDGMLGAMRDDVFNQSMSYSDIGKAFQQVKEKTGRSVDALIAGFAGSASLEFYSELDGSVNYVWGTQTPVSGFGLPPAAPMLEIQRSYANGFSRDPLEVARTFEYVAADSPTSPTMLPTSSVFDMSQLHDVQKAVKNLKDNLKNVPSEILQKIIDDTQEGGIAGDREVFRQSKDAVHFAGQIAESSEITDPAIKASAQNLVSVLQNAIKGDAEANPYYASANGANMFLTTKYGHLRPDVSPVPENWDGKYGYEQTAFDKATGMHELLDRVSPEPFSEKILGKNFTNKAAALKNANIAPSVKTLGSLASNIGWFEMMDAGFNGGKAANVFGISARYVPYVAIAGGLKTMGDAANYLHWLFTKQKNLKSDLKRDNIIQQGLNFALNGAAMALAGAGMIFPPLAPFVAPAAKLVVYKWVADQVYGIYSQYKNESDTVIFSDFLTDLENVPYDKEVRHNLSRALVNWLASKKKWDR